jgi:hypothetical protein
MPKYISNQAVSEVSATRKMEVGTLVETPDGSKFRYAVANASVDLVAANLMVAADPIANHGNRLIDDVVTAPAIGDSKVTLRSIGATALTFDQYQDGYLVTQDGTGEGFKYQIQGHKAYDASSDNVTIDLRDKIEVALVAASEVTLEYNPYAQVVISATDQADLALGIAHRAVDVSVARYFFIQTGGPCVVWADEAFASGTSLTIGTGTAGQVEAADAVAEPVIGLAMRLGVDGEHTLAFLTID